TRPVELPDVCVAARVARNLARNGRKAYRERVQVRLHPQQPSDNSVSGLPAERALDHIVHLLLYARVLHQGNYSLRSPGLEGLVGLTDQSPKRGQILVSVAAGFADLSFKREQLPLEGLDIREVGNKMLVKTLRF